MMAILSLNIDAQGISLNFFFLISLYSSKAFGFAPKLKS
jgi:hypothetical protein